MGKFLYKNAKKSGMALDLFEAAVLTRHLPWCPAALPAQDKDAVVFLADAPEAVFFLYWQLFLWMAAKEQAKLFC